MLQNITVHSNLVKPTKCATESPNVTYNCKASVATFDTKNVTYER